MNTPLVLSLVIHAAKSVGWDVERGLQGDRIIVTEAGPTMNRQPRRWIITAEEQLYESR